MDSSDCRTENGVAVRHEPGEGSTEHKSVKFSDMRGEFYTLQLLPPGNTQYFREKLKTTLPNVFGRVKLKGGYP